MTRTDKKQTKIMRFDSEETCLLVDLMHDQHLETRPTRIFDSSRLFGSRPTRIFDVRRDDVRRYLETRHNSNYVATTKVIASYQK